MKYCSKCGAEIMDEAYVCPHCGCKTEPEKAQGNAGNTLRTIAKIFMLISCGMWAVVFLIYLALTTILACLISLIPLSWIIPMTVVYWKKVAHHQPVGTGFKVCTLLFVNTIAGILMLCDNNND